MGEGARARCAQHTSGACGPCHGAAPSVVYLLMKTAQFQSDSVLPAVQDWFSKRAFGVKRCVWGAWMENTLCWSTAAINVSSCALFQIRTTGSFTVTSGWVVVEEIPSIVRVPTAIGASCKDHTPRAKLRRLVLSDFCLGWSTPTLHDAVCVVARRTPALFQCSLARSVCLCDESGPLRRLWDVLSSLLPLSADRVV